ncbi:ABC transporter substrate-binding protein [uncultured Oscillibacter sp.]|uniref:ABC transporter substrate-binding protein n=1 Tax=uncultured Oscillibacter sp. TaxID=876091 RepID=UPI0026096B26|nr:ABC transporter substrate-binding protein [uncultured Oscillibacter sp.]
MRRFFPIALLALGLVLCSACGAGRNSPGDSSNEDLIVVGMCQVGAESDWRVANSESMKAVFTEENGYRLLFDDARQKQENQITAIRKFIQQQVDYIVLMPISESGWDSVLQEAKEAGIPVILVDRMVDVEDESLYAAHIGSDFLKEGRLAVAWMEDAFREAEDPVRVIHIQGTLGSTAQLGRTAALEEAVETHENWELPAQMDGDFTQAKTYEVMTEYLSSLPGGRDIDVVYCENDNIAFGALQALEEQGYACGPDGVSIITFDATRGALTECLNGRIALAVECNPLLGPLVETVIQDMEAGRTPEKHSFVEERVFTSENLTAALVESRAY